MSTPICPWCSASLKGNPAVCPSCGAALRDRTSDDIPGVTTLDPRAATKPVSKRGIAAWLVGEREQEEAGIGKIEPPSKAVREEMLKLELAALDAEIESRKNQVAAEQVAEAAPLEAKETDAQPSPE